MSSRPVKAPGDLKGLTVRSSGILADVASALGASPVSMPQSDTPEALQKGVVQGVFSSFDVLKDYAFAESCRHGLVLDGPVYPFMVFMNRKTWESLPGNVQQAVMDLAPEHSAWVGGYVDAHGLEAVQWSEATHGFTLTRLDAAQKKALLQTAEPAIDAWVKRASGKGVDAKALLEEVLRAKEALGKRRLRNKDAS
jgi:TRAP-type C4-dicarboxylate transport system substrate-binding protein